MNHRARSYVKLFAAAATEEVTRLVVSESYAFFKEYYLHV